MLVKCRYVHVLSIHEQSPPTNIEKRNLCNQCGVIGKYVSGSENEIVNSRSRSLTRQWRVERERGGGEREREGEGG